MAVQAVRLGAYEFVEKPFKNDKLLKTVEQAEVVLEELTELRERFESLTQRQKETMRYLIAVQQRTLEEQKNFFERFVYDGAVAFCAAVSDSEQASFYKHAVRLMRVFLDIEKNAFSML